MQPAPLGRGQSLQIPEVCSCCSFFTMSWFFQPFDPSCSVSEMTWNTGNQTSGRDSSCRTGLEIEKDLYSLAGTIRACWHSWGSDIVSISIENSGIRYFSVLCYPGSNIGLEKNRLCLCDHCYFFCCFIRMLVCYQSREKASVCC